MKRKIASNTDYYSLIYPAPFGKEYGKTSGGKGAPVKGGENEKVTTKGEGDPSNADGKFLSNEVTKKYESKGHKMNQNENDSKDQQKGLNSSWKKQEKGFNSVVEAGQKIINNRFAKFQNALESSAESLYKNIESNPVREKLYAGFRSAGYDSSTAKYIIENAMDDSAQEFHSAFIKEANSINSLAGKEFVKKIREIEASDKEANPLVLDTNPGVANPGIPEGMNQPQIDPEADLTITISDGSPDQGLSNGYPMSEDKAEGEDSYSMDAPIQDGTNAEAMSEDEMDKAASSFWSTKGNRVI